MNTCIVIPAYNEEKRIARTLTAYAQYFSGLDAQSNGNTELLVVLNGCKDNTAGVVRELQQQFPSIGMINLPQAGKGLAIAHGFKDALTRNHDFIGFVDADMATAPEQFHDLLRNVDATDGVVASRYMPGSQVFPQRPWIKYWGRRLVYDKLVYLLFGMNMYDFQCGAKLFKRHAIERVVPHCTVGQWAFDVELLYLHKKHGFTVKEIPTIWRDQADSKLAIMGSGMRMLSSVIKLRVRHSPLRRLVGD